MSSLLKALHFGKGKHKKLPEEWGEGIKSTVNDGMNFYVKCLGSTPVDQPSSESATADAIKSIIAMARMSGKKLPRITLTIKPSGVCTTDVTSGQKVMDISIYRISYCSADATYDRVVAIICTNKNETLECHAFLTAKKKVAQAAALTISQAFTIAFENWQNAKNQASSNTCSGGHKSRKCLSPSSHSTGPGKLSNVARDCMHNDHNENKEPQQSLGGSKKKKDLDTLIDLSFEETTPHQATPATQSDAGHDNEKREVGLFDADLDDSFSRLAQSRSATGQPAAAGGTSKPGGDTLLPLTNHLQFDDSFKPVTPAALTSSGNILPPPRAKPSRQLILPTNVKACDFDVGELNSLFNNAGDNKQESDRFFADCDDFFSL